MMNNTDTEWVVDDPLSGEAADVLVDAIRPVPLDAARQARLRAGIAERIQARPRDSESLARLATPQFVTAYAKQLNWQPLAPGVEIKILDETPPYRSCYLRLAAGARLPAHPHSGEELCVVMEGSAHLGDIYAEAGDLHVAMPGSFHQEIYTETGCLLFIRSPLEQHRLHV